MSKQTSVQQSVDMISEFLGPIRAQAQKEAEAASFRDTAAATPGSQSNSAPESTSQTTLGNEQSQAAKDSGSTAPDEKPNSDADAQQAADTQGTQTLTVDDKVREQGNIGPVSDTEISQEQKMARASRLGNEILYQLEASLDKRATGGSKKPSSQEGPYIPNSADSDFEEEDGDKLAAEMNPVMLQLAKTAGDAAQEFYEGYLSGMVKRAQDEIEVETSVPASVLKQAGGVRALLDKVAEETPEAVLPEGVLPEGVEIPPEVLEEGAVPVGDIPAEGEVAGLTEDADVSEEDLEAIGAQLEEAGVTPEELQQAIEDVAALQEAGVSPEELAAALSGEAEGDVAGEIPADVVPEAALEPEAKEASDQTLSKINEILNR